MKRKQFVVQAKLNLWTSITVTASSLEEALAEAKKLNESDFVEFQGDFIDGDFRITGAYEL